MSEANHECRIMVFRPTMEEFKDFNRYIQHMESLGAHRGGIAKIIPPKEWVPRKSYDNIDNFVIPAPISQVVTGQKGLFTQYNIQKKPMTVKEFRRLTNTPRFEPPFHESYEELERMYWKNITFNPPIYGADISGSLYDKGVKEWNVAHLNTLLDVIELDSGVKIEGVNTAYLYFGMWKTTFAWHTEDMDLYSINYVHFGAPKSWYSVPPEHGKRLERLACGFFPNSKSNCLAFLRHKMTMISPNILKQYGIPVNKMTQEAGEFIVTFPYGYHAGFNHGYNCAESTNFASQRWINYGRNADKCSCRNDTVTIDMDVFVEIFQAEQYEEWVRKRQEVKLSYNEIPSKPDFAKPYTSWRVKVEEYRKIHGSIEFKRKKLTLPRRSPNKPKDSSKSPHKQKAKSPKVVEKKSPPSPLMPSAQQQERLKGGIAYEGVAAETADAHCSASVQHMSVDTPPECKLLQGHPSVFDRVKSGARRMSSARAIFSFMDDLPPTAIPPPGAFLPAVKVDNGGKARLASDNKQHPDDEVRSNCTVKCEPLSSLALEEVGEERFIIKKDSKLHRKERSKQTIKRRHPVVRKGMSKKACSKVLLQKDEEQPQKPVESSTPCPLPASPESGASFKEERDYNASIAKLVPHCAICSLFKPYLSTPLEEVLTARGLPQAVPTVPAGKAASVAGNRTCPLIPEVSFASSVNHPSPLAVCRLLGGDGKSALLQCCVCQLQVHASCYGVEHAPKKKAHWTCDRCMKREWTTQCTLCCIKGGALKRISGGHGWAHIVCAIAIPEVFFDDTVQRKGINVSKVTLSRLKLKCYYCKDSKYNQTSGVCLQCCACKCAVSFHTTCAHAAGIPIEAGNWPFPVYVHCKEHSLMKVTGLEAEQGPPVDVDDNVVAKHKNGKYYRGKVSQVNSVNYHKVNFKDNSWSDNLYQQDIVNHDWASGLTPEVGGIVQVKWTDGDLYEAEYRGHSVHQVVKVKFDDGSILDLERANVYTEGEAIPARIRRKMAKVIKLESEMTSTSSVTV